MYGDVNQQNICLALYQHGARLGAEGADLVELDRSVCSMIRAVGGAGGK